MIQGIQKAVTSFITSTVALVAIYVPEVNAVITDEQIASASVLVSTFLVWFIPNK